MSNPGKSDFGYGFQDPFDTASEYSTFHFAVRQIMSSMRTATLMQVSAVTGGGPNADCYVSAKPLVKITDGLNNASSHGTVNNLLVWRMRTGQAGFIADPVAGDIGLVVVCDRDISAVKNSGAESPPGSRRRFDMADGIYFGAMLNTTLTTYLQLLAAGMNYLDASGNTLVGNSSGLVINGTTIPQGGSGTGVSGTFTSQDGKTITVTKGIITGIV